MKKLDRFVVKNKVISMKFRKVILLFLLFLLTGCSVEYNLIVNEDKNIEESVVVLQPNSFWGNTREEIEEQLFWTLVFSKDETEPAYFYNQEQILGDVNSGVKYSYEFKNIENFESESEILKNCFESYNVELDNNILSINASGFKCMSVLGDDFNININIISDGKVITGNYDKNNYNKYTWNINSDDIINIELSIDTSKINTQAFTDIFVPVLIIFVVLLLFGMILFAYIKNRKNNS